MPHVIKPQSVNLESKVVCFHPLTSLILPLINSPLGCLPTPSTNPLRPQTANQNLIPLQESHLPDICLKNLISKNFFVSLFGRRQSPFPSCKTQPRPPHQQSSQPCPASTPTTRRSLRSRRPTDLPVSRTQRTV